MKKFCFVLNGVVASIIFLTGCSDLQQPNSVSLEDGDYLKSAGVPTLTKIKTINNWNGTLPSMIMSTDPQYLGNMEIVRRNGYTLQHLWWDGDANHDWNLVATFGSNIRSNAALCSNLNDNLLQVVVREYGYLVHYWRRGDNHEWVREAELNPPIPNNYYYLNDPTMICNSVTHNLEVAAVDLGSSDCIHYYVRNGDDWGSPQRLYSLWGGVVKGSPVLVQDPTGTCWLTAFFMKDNQNSIMVWRKNVNGSWYKDKQGLTAGDTNEKPAVVSVSYLSILVKVKGQTKTLVEYSQSIYASMSDRTIQINDPISMLSATSLNNKFYLFNGGTNPPTLYENIGQPIIMR